MLWFLTSYMCSLNNTSSVFLFLACVVSCSSGSWSYVERQLPAKHYWKLRIKTCMQKMVLALKEACPDLRAGWSLQHLLEKLKWVHCYGHPGLSSFQGPPGIPSVSEPLSSAVDRGIEIGIWNMEVSRKGRRKKALLGENSCQNSTTQEGNVKKLLCESSKK